jgi:hypothetical protein
MKKLILTLAIAAVTTLSYAQGTLQFNNAIGSRFNLTDAAGQTGLLPTNAPVNFGLFYGHTSGNLTLVSVLGAPSPTSPGFMVAPNGTAFQLATAGGEVTAANEQVFVRVRAWSASFGTDWQAARTAYLAGTPGVMYGEAGASANSIVGTEILSELLGAAGGPGSFLWQGTTGTDPNRFTPMTVITAVPEPSTIALGVLGAGALCLLRRKK